MTLGDIDIEIWQPLLGYEGLYAISNMGKIKTLGNRYNGYKTLVLKTRLDKDGYEIVNIYKKGKMKTCKVHRLVALNFIPNPQNKKEVNHKKGIRDDNRVSQLEWVTISENMQHRINTLGCIVNNLPILIGNKNHKSKAVRCVTLGIDFQSIRQAAIALGFKNDKISQFLLGKINYCDGLYFTYTK